MTMAWVATIPAAAVTAAAVYGLVKLPPPVSTILVVAVLAALAGSVVVATRRTLRAADLEREIAEHGRRSAPTTMPA
jgi:hypothetical protein